MILPVRPWRVTSHFGPRVHPIYGGRRHHNGLDISVPRNTPIVASADGTVTHRWRGRRGGLSLRVRYPSIQLDGEPVVMGYAHLSSAAVRSGESVRAGQVIGRVGSSGASTGPHLHWTVRPGGGEAIDPEKLLDDGAALPTAAVGASWSPWVWGAAAAAALVGAALAQSAPDETEER